MRRLWEFLAFVIIIAMFVEMAIDIIRPLMPYMLIAVLLIVGGGAAYHRNRSW